MANPDKELFKTVYTVAFPQNYARSVACNPVNADQFVIGEANSRLSIHSIRNRESLCSVAIPPDINIKSIATACSYSRDGRKIMCTTHTQKVCVVDAEAGKTIRTYENSAYRTQLKSGLAVDLSKDYLMASTELGGKGITFYDIRQPSPINSFAKIHVTWVPDMEFVPVGWPWSRYSNCILTVCTDGQVKVMTLDGKMLEVVDVGHVAHGCALTPEIFEAVGYENTGFAGFATVAGECLSTVIPAFGLDRKIALPQLSNALRIKFSSSGSRAFVACDDGSMRLYQRLPQALREQGTLALHQQAISDLAITSSDEYIITTSEDRNVFVTKVGPPNHGTTEWFEIA